MDEIARAMRDAAERATGGEWRYDGDISRVYTAPSDLCIAAVHIKGNPACEQPWPADATYIVAAQPKNVIALLDERDRLRTALRMIACYDDKGANDRLKATGRFSAFDEPGSVEIARAALGGSDA